MLQRRGRIIRTRPPSPSWRTKLPATSAMEAGFVRKGNVARRCGRYPLLACLSWRTSESFCRRSILRHPRTWILPWQITASHGAFFSPHDPGDSSLRWFLYKPHSTRDVSFHCTPSSPGSRNGGRTVCQSHRAEIPLRIPRATPSVGHKLQAAVIHMCRFVTSGLFFP